MPTVLVVPAGDELKDGQLRVAAGWPHVAVDQFGLERGKEALGHGVVPACTWPTDALAYVMSRQQFAVGGAGVLTGFKGTLQHRRVELLWVNQNGGSLTGPYEPECTHQVAHRWHVERTGNGSGRPLPKA